MLDRRWGITIVVALLAVFGVAWLVSSVGDMHDRLHRVSPIVGLGFIVFASLLAGVLAVFLCRFFWTFGRGSRAPDAKAPESVVEAAAVQADQAKSVVEQIQDPAAKQKLNRELAELGTDRKTRRFHVVVFGTSSAGKTSLINALIGRDVGKVEATMGTTRHGEAHTYTLEDVDGTILLTDSPGLSEVGNGGAQREADARNLAARADLLLFVVDHDLIRSEFEPLAALARQGKRSILVLNKTDRLIDADRDAILGKLRERLAGIIPPRDIVTAAASPRPMPVRIQREDGSVATVQEDQEPDVAEVRERISEVLESEGEILRAGNLLLRAHLVGQAAREQLTTERDRRAQAVVDKFQWITAGTVFANPVPALDLMAAGAVHFQMISEIAAVYGVELTSGHVRMIGGQMVQMLLKTGMVEATTSLIAGLFKSTLVGYAAGGAVQAVSMAYLAHISGGAFVEYFRRGQTWGDGGMQAALNRQFDLNSRAEFLQEFAKQALQRVKASYFKTAEPKVGG